jgi:MoaA/NifB/PqqE/SkfB family radical SAM enzyme
MTSKFLQNIFGIRPQRSFSAWQIELTTRCPLRCRMCIREGLPGWKSHDMPMAEFRKLVPCFEVVQNVVLEGWGEPLLHPHLLEAVRLVKQQGARAGFVTSGKGLSQDYSRELIDAGVDFLGFSLAGATAATHNAIRVNSDFQELLKSIRQLVKIKLGQKAGTPRLHIVYLMLRDNLHEVPLLLDIARQVGLDEEVLINLVHITNAWQESQRVFRCEEQATEWLLVNLQQQARKLNIRRYQAASTPRPGGCAPTIRCAICTWRQMVRLPLCLPGSAHRITISPNLLRQQAPCGKSRIRKPFRGASCCALGASPLHCLPRVLYGTQPSI